MTLPSDPLAAIVALLRDDPALAELVGGRIYGATRPNAGEDAHPGPALVLTPTGGPPSTGLPLADVEIEARCWGGLGHGAPARALAIWRALHAACNVADRNAAGSRLLWAVEAGGPALLFDPDTQEPFVRCDLRVATADEPLATTPNS